MIHHALAHTHACKHVSARSSSCSPSPHHAGALALRHSCTSHAHLHPRMQVQALAGLEGSPHVIRYYNAWIEPAWEKLGAALAKSGGLEELLAQARNFQGSSVPAPLVSVGLGGGFPGTTMHHHAAHAAGPAGAAPTGGYTAQAQARPQAGRRTSASPPPKAKHSSLSRGRHAAAGLGQPQQAAAVKPGTCAIQELGSSPSGPESGSHLARGAGPHAQGGAQSSRRGADGKDGPRRGVSPRQKGGSKQPQQASLQQPIVTLPSSPSEGYSVQQPIVVMPSSSPEASTTQGE